MVRIFAGTLSFSTPPYRAEADVRYIYRNCSALRVVFSVNHGGSTRQCKRRSHAAFPAFDRSRRKEMRVACRWLACGLIGFGRRDLQRPQFCVKSAGFRSSQRFFLSVKWGEGDTRLLGWILSLQCKGPHRLWTLAVGRSPPVSRRAFPALGIIPSEHLVPISDESKIVCIRYRRQVRNRNE